MILILLNTEPSPLHTTTIVEKCTLKLVDEYNHMLCQATEPLSTFLEYIRFMNCNFVFSCISVSSICIAYQYRSWYMTNCKVPLVFLVLPSLLTDFCYGNPCSYKWCIHFPSMYAVLIDSNALSALVCIITK